MPRIYTEIRISHKNVVEQLAFEEKLDIQVKTAGLESRADYIRLVTNLDAATGIIEALKINQED